jgi:hypothetical protein
MHTHLHTPQRDRPRAGDGRLARGQGRGPQRREVQCVGEHNLATQLPCQPTKCNTHTHTHTHTHTRTHTWEHGFDAQGASDSWAHSSSDANT